MARPVKTATIVKRPAQIYKRMVAYLIDIIIISFIVVWPFNDILKKLNGIDDWNYYTKFQFLMNNPEKTIQLALISLLIVILTLVYWTILEFKLRQSIGKMIMNIKVVSKRKNFTISQCLVRNISKPLDLVFLFDVIYLLFNKESRQRYFEKISDTLVIEEVLKI
jgi:uncharacterized RDD family membrane protein YckC